MSEFEKEDLIRLLKWYIKASKDCDCLDWEDFFDYHVDDYIFPSSLPTDHDLIIALIEIMRDLYVIGENEKPKDLF